MTQTLLGILIGTITSLIAGILLILWGEQTVGHLRKLPTKRRVATYSRAYIRALRGYPYRYIHMLALTVWATIPILLFLGYGFATYLAFSLDLAHPTATTHDAVKAALAPVSHFADCIMNPWILLGITVSEVCAGARIIFITLPSEKLVPYAYRELLRLRECVAKCGTNKQFLAYTDAEHKVQNVDDLRALILQAKDVLGTDGLELANDILEGITGDAPIPTSVVRPAISDHESGNETAKN